MRQYRLVAKCAMLAAMTTMLPGMQGRTTNLDGRLLASHNRERDLMGVSTLDWNEGLADGAQRWANYLAETGRFEHSPDLPGRPREGENIWGGTLNTFTPEAMVGLWIAEKSSFVPGTFPANSVSGRVQDVSHYTQIVWRRTGEVGCAMAKGKTEEILVCRYSEPGNIIGHRPL